MNLSTNTDKNNYNSYKNTNEFEYNVISILQSTPFIRKRNLIEKLRTQFKKTRGYSVENIQKNLYEMQGAGTLLVIQYEDLHKYGIKEEDKRSRYVTLRKTENISYFLDSVINKLEFNNPIQQKMALKEIENYEQNYVLNPKQLDLLVSQLKTDDVTLIDHILRILYTYIDKKNIEPASDSETVKILRSLLNKFPEPLKHSLKSLRTHIIYLLGHYNDASVIERLKKDAETLDNLHEIIHDYESEYTANIIEEQREELYNFEEQLRLDDKEEQAQFIAELRVRSLINLGMKENPFKDNNIEGAEF
ncbi:hypothetical protein HNV12_16120 [Methanococcoides sp. SA1]|nr:hypothetical protein [Methanococcoides sp. SA1]NPE29450.1 hypothetical protein [Methanococcoides sp. SA1]